MAKWGEGDPRWIVEERPDATNVNNWHWTERNASPWSQDRIKALFDNCKLKVDGGDVCIKEVDKCEGEASASNRKGKLIFFFEWNIVLKWEGTLKGGSDKVHNGTIQIPNLSEENDISEIDIQVILKDGDGEGQKLKEIIHKLGKDTIRQQLSEYVTSLRKEFSKGMILPKKDQVKPDSINNLSSGFNKKVSMQPIVNSSQKSTLVKIDTSTVKINEKFQCRAQELYEALTRVDMVMAFTRSEVKMDPVKGGKFELFGGNITGTFEELEPGKKIVQQWRYKQWPAEHFSNVTISINEKGDHTAINLVQTGVPSSEVDVTKQNWDRYYWNSIKQVFGFGSFLD